MSPNSHLIVYNKIKPEIELGISIASFWVTNKSFRNYVLIKTPFISMILCLIFSLIHLASKFEGQLTTNFVMSQILFLASLQIILKTLWMWYNRDNLLQLLDKTNTLHTDYENEEICAIAERNLKKLSNIWIVSFK